jgi:hypothetical protein
LTTIVEGWSVSGRLVLIDYYIKTLTVVSLAGARFVFPNLIKKTGFHPLDSAWDIGREIAFLDQPGKKK